MIPTPMSAVGDVCSLDSLVRDLTDLLAVFDPRVVSQFWDGPRADRLTLDLHHHRAALVDTIRWLQSRRPLLMGPVRP